MAAITSANAANAIVKLVATEALAQLQGTLVMGNLVNRNFEPALAAGGDVVNVPIPPTLTANNIAETGTVTNQVASLGNAQVVLNTHAEASFQIGDVVKVLANPDLTKIYLSAAISAIADRIELDLMKLYALLTDNAELGGAGAISEIIMDDAETVLFNAKIPTPEPRYLVVTGGTYGDIRSITRFSEMQTIGTPLALIEGTVGKLKNLLIFRHHQVQLATTYKNLCFARDAFALVTRRLPQPLPGTGAIAEYAELGNFGMRIVMSYAPNSLAQQFTVDVLYGVGVLRNKFGVVVATNTA